MKISFFIISLLTPFVLLAALKPAELSTEDLTQLQTANKIVIKTKKVQDAPWPEITLYTTIDASPENAFSIFTAYKHQKDYIPNMIKSSLVQKKTPNNTYVSYETKTPWPWPNTLYTTANVIGKISKDTYKLEWYLISSNSLKDTRGFAIFSPYKGKTLMKYSTFIYPDSIFASFVKGLMKKGLLQTIEAIKIHIEGINKKNPQLVERYRKNLLLNFKK